MPGLIFMQRRFHIGSDDLVYPAMSLAFARLCWTATLVAYVAHVLVVLRRKGGREGCGSTSAVAAVLFGLAALGSASICANAAVGFLSARGVILSQKARRGVPMMLQVSGLFLICEALLTPVVMWLAWSPRRMSMCTRIIRGDDFERVVLRLVATAQTVALGLTIIAVILVFDPQGSRKVASGERSTLRVGSELEVVELTLDSDEITECCESICACAVFATCGLFGGSHFSSAARSRRRTRRSRQQVDASAPTDDAATVASSTLADIADVLSLFLGSLDIVATDILAGLALVRAQQRAHIKQRLLRAASRQSPSSSAVTGPIDLVGHPSYEQSMHNQLVQTSIAQDAARHIDYALAVYGWKLLTYMSPFAGLVCALRACRLCGACCDSLDAVALRMRAGPKASVIFESFRVVANELVPVAVFANDQERELIVACRGTLSLDDCVTDATARAAPIEPDFAPAAVTNSSDKHQYFAHSGILRVAIHVKRLVWRYIAEALDGERAGYEIVVVGHSLGAGVAALLALSLKQRYPSTRCLAYAPPGALVDPLLADSMSQFCTSFVVGDDVVPRLGLAALFRLRDHVIAGVAKSSVHKRFALASFLSAFPDLDSLFYRADDPAYTEANRLTNDCIASLRRDRATDTLLATPLTLPGTVVHLVDAQGGRNRTPTFCELMAPYCTWLPFRCRGRSRGQLAAFSTPRDFFADITISKRMFRDHMPWVVQAAISQLPDDLDALPRQTYMLRRIDDPAYVALSEAPSESPS